MGLPPQHTPIMRDGLSPSRQVDVAAVGRVVGEHGVLPRLAGRLALVVVAADARLAEVVDARPDEVADDVLVVHRRAVVAVGVAGVALGLHHHALGHALVVALSLEDHVVVAHDVVTGGQGVVDVPVAVPGGQSRRHGAPLGVELAYELCHLRGRLDDAYVLALYHLVARRPAEDAGVAAVAAYERAQVLLPPLVDQLVVVVRVLLVAPAVEGLVDDQQAQLVAGPQEGLRGRVVRGAHGVESALLQQAHLAVLGFVVRGRAEHAVVVVDAGAVELQRLAVEQQAPLG